MESVAQSAATAISDVFQVAALAPTHHRHVNEPGTAAPRHRRRALALCQWSGCQRMKSEYSGLGLQVAEVTTVYCSGGGPRPIGDPHPHSFASAMTFDAVLVDRVSGSSPAPGGRLSPLHRRGPSRPGWGLYWHRARMLANLNSRSRAIRISEQRCPSSIHHSRSRRQTSEISGGLARSQGRRRCHQGSAVFLSWAKPQAARLSTPVAC